MYLSVPERGTYERTAEVRAASSERGCRALRTGPDKPAENGNLPGRDARFQELHGGFPDCVSKRGRTSVLIICTYHSTCVHPHSGEALFTQRERKQPRREVLAVRHDLVFERASRARVAAHHPQQVSEVTGRFVQDRLKSGPVVGTEQLLGRPAVSLK